MQSDAEPAPDLPEYLPAGQAVHVADEAAARISEYVPGGQSEHVWELAGVYEPG